MTTKKTTKKKDTTTTKKTKSAPRGYTKAKAEFILDKIASGMNITKIHQQHPLMCPESKCVWKWASKNESFREELTVAYDLYIRALVDEFDILSQTRLSELYPSLDPDEGKELRRSRMQALQFMILKVAPFYTLHFTEKTVVKHEGLDNVGTTIVIANYALSEDEVGLKVVNPAALPLGVSTTTGES